ncbi:MAG: hisc: histidinol-phosphate transaminase [Verrucomicrobia bacterium]|nr:hisc: histidinol-phosphate transaminase [Verrucomicrobiota bacterium]
MALPFELNPVLKDLPVYVPGRPIEEVAREVGLPADEIIKIASNENPLGPSPMAMAALQELLPKLHLYPDGNAFYLRKKLASIHGVEPGNLVFGNGSNEIIEFVGHAFMRPGVDVIVSQYSFAIYPIMAKLFGANVITVPAKEKAMVKAITPNTRVMFVATPNNPTGTLSSKGELADLVNQVPPHVMLVVDEAYIEFLKDPVDFLPLIRRGDFPNIILMRTFSKIFGLAGLRVGYGIGHPEVIAALEKIRQPFNLNLPAQVGAMAALDDIDHVMRTRALNQAGLEFYELAFHKLNLEFIPSAANFILVKVGDGQKVFLGLQKLGIITRPMGGYGLGEWLRISVGTGAENQRCLEALKQVL